jgi:hypothetical protein
MDIWEDHCKRGARYNLELFADGALLTVLPLSTQPIKFHVLRKTLALATNHNCTSP